MIYETFVLAYKKHVYGPREPKRKKENDRTTTGIRFTYLYDNCDLRAIFAVHIVLVRERNRRLFHPFRRQMIQRSYYKNIKCSMNENWERFSYRMIRNDSVLCILIIFLENQPLNIPISCQEYKGIYFIAKLLYLRIRWYNDLLRVNWYTLIAYETVERIID